MTTTLVATVDQKFSVTGMTCGHCKVAVAAELSDLKGAFHRTDSLGSAPGRI